MNLFHIKLEKMHESLAHKTLL